MVAVCPATAYIAGNEQDHGPNDDRDQHGVYLVDEIDQRRVFSIRLIVTQPGIGEIGSRVRVTLLTGPQQVFFHDGTARIISAHDVMRAVTIDTNGRIKGLTGRHSLEERNRRAVEIRHIGIEDISTDIVLGHEFFVSMAGGA